jgi:hypothetical protein
MKMIISNSHKVRKAKFAYNSTGGSVSSALGAGWFLGDLKGTLPCSSSPSIHPTHSFAIAVKHHCFFPSPHCKPPSNKHPSLLSFRVSDMQPNCVANLACLPGFDMASFFLPQIQNDPMYDFSSFDMVDLDPYPYSCNGSVTTTIVSSVSAAAADNHQERRGHDERKKRRLASNRESARRSRVRKQRRLDELSLQVAELLGTNHRLLVELNHVIAKHAAVARENAKLREEADGLQRRLSEMEAGVGEAEAEAGTPDVA